MKPEKTEPEVPAVDMKAKMKKKTSKLFAKMKSKGKNFLDNKATTASLEPEKEVAREHCAFCQEELDPSDFLKNPYGNFAHIQSTNLLYHAMQ